MSTAIDMSLPHRRYNPLIGEWVLVSPQRTQRPWQGSQERQATTSRPEYLPDCYLCPTNERAGGAKNPAYKKPYVFTNDFAAILPGTPDHSENHPLFKIESASGTCRVLCFSPQHNLTLPDMSINAIEDVIRSWMEQTLELGKEYNWVQVFENKGTLMGCSNEHPHGQIWASRALPTIPEKENLYQQKYLTEHDRPLLVDYLDRELENGERVVMENEHWAVVVPYWAVWPYEIMLLPKRHIKRLPDLGQDEVISLAAIMKTVLQKYDRLFDISFPYTMGWHGAPFLADDNDHWQLHAHAYPPLLRSATIRKFMVGYEMLCEPQRDITSEQAAEILRSLP
ncbi:UDP-glucose--hexose-1-phosphate uridylyltransferase [Candidatus Neomarinimicrobiota bacterium]